MVRSIPGIVERDERLRTASARSRMGRDAAHPYRIVIGRRFDRSRRRLRKDYLFATRGVIATTRSETSSPPPADASAIRE